MKIVVAQRYGKRGAGLGNEILPWGKGWIASQVLGARLVGPSWGINQRRYDRNFGTSRFDFVLEDMLQKLPHFSFGEDDYRATGEVDFGAAIGKWAARRGLDRRSSFIVSVGGMWGGYPAIGRARSFLWSRLLGSRDALRNMFEIGARLDRSKLFVAVHMRCGRDGFATPAEGENIRGRFNIFVPAAWYLWVCEELERAFRGRIQFWFFTDRRGPEFEEAIRRFNPGQPVPQGFTECSDLLLMAQAHLRVCSVSSYSLAACYLSQGPYVWYEPQLALSRGAYRLWPSEHAQQALREPLRPSASLAAPMNVGELLPISLIEQLEQKLAMLDPTTNLIEYGSIPAACPLEPALRR